MIGSNINNGLSDLMKIRSNRNCKMRITSEKYEIFNKSSTRARTRARTRPPYPFHPVYNAFIAFK